MSLVENIKSLCDTKGISIPKLEKELEFGRGSIYNWEKSSPSIDKVKKVADYFNVSVDRVLYGYEASQFEQLVRFIMNKRTCEQFANDTGIALEVVEDIAMGLTTEQPTLEIVKKIASSNPVKLIVDDESLYRAAGYSKEDMDDFENKQYIRINKLIELFEECGFEVRIENENYYEKVYVDHDKHGTVLSVYLHEFIDRGESIIEELKHKYGNDDIETIAAHHDGEDWTEEELEDIERFKEFLKSKRKQQG